MCAVSFPCYLKKYFPDNFALARVYLQILYRAAFFVHSALIDRTVAERDRMPPYPICRTEKQSV